MIRLSTAVLLLGALVLSSAAEARGGRSFGGFRKSSPAPQAKAVAPAASATAAPTRGNVNVFVPVPVRRRESQRTAGDKGSGAAPLGVATPILPASASAPGLPAPSAAPRPWCESGHVVGGLCLLN
jgi:hypothetical protein